ncbi:MAG TPA: transglycosylase SLT domain-containing protein [Candidatus Eisenbacteria bacterium]|nr:transglycosylase SLT domain-containing protein [Candidatus Eisenbacteria bacterium]
MQPKSWILFALVSGAQFFTVSPLFADVYMYRDKQGVITFTNVPTHAGYRRILKENGSGIGAASRWDGSYDEIIRSASDRHSIDADLIRAVIKVESDFNSTARSHKGAAGLMQLMPETARLHNVADIYDPNDNIEGGVRHLKLLLNRFAGDLQLTLAAYNAGIKAVEKYGGIPPFAETQEYVRRVLRYYRTYNGHRLESLRQISSSHP